MLLVQLVFFVIGLAILLVFANLFVNAAVKLAYLLKVSPLIIGAIGDQFGSLDLRESTEADRKADRWLFAWGRLCYKLEVEKS